MNPYRSKVRKVSQLYRKKESNYLAVSFRRISQVGLAVKLSLVCHVKNFQPSQNRESLWFFAAVSASVCLVKLLLRSRKLSLPTVVSSILGLVCLFLCFASSHITIHSTYLRVKTKSGKGWVHQPLRVCLGCSLPVGLSGPSFSGLLTLSYVLPVL